MSRASQSRRRLAVCATVAAADTCSYLALFSYRLSSMMDWNTPRAEQAYNKLPPSVASGEPASPTSVLAITVFDVPNARQTTIAGRNGAGATAWAGILCSHFVPRCYNIPPLRLLMNAASLAVETSLSTSACENSRFSLLPYLSAYLNSAVGDAHGFRHQGILGGGGEENLPVLPGLPAWCCF